MTTRAIDPSDYIKAFISQRPIDFGRAVLVVVDMQYATGHRNGALGRRMAEERSNLAAYRFDRIGTLMVPDIRRRPGRLLEGGADDAAIAPRAGVLVVLDVGANPERHPAPVRPAQGRSPDDRRIDAAIRFHGRRALICRHPTR